MSDEARQRRVLNGAIGAAIGGHMTEDELLLGITQALTLAGWRWTHIRRSDQAIAMGDQGFPDLIAVHPRRGQLLAFELKAAKGATTHDQVAWLYALGTVETVDARVVRPADYDAILRQILRVDERVELP